MLGSPSLTRSLEKLGMAIAASMSFTRAGTASAIAAATCSMCVASRPWGSWSTVLLRVGPRWRNRLRTEVLGENTTWLVELSMLASAPTYTSVAMVDASKKASCDTRSDGR